jgi:hypothetical protein
VVSITNLAGSGSSRKVIHHRKGLKYRGCGISERGRKKIRRAARRFAGNSGPVQKAALETV